MIATDDAAILEELGRLLDEAERTNDDAVVRQLTLDDLEADLRDRPAARRSA